MQKTKTPTASEQDAEIAGFIESAKSVKNFVVRNLWTVYTTKESPENMTMENLLKMVSPETRAVIHAAADLQLSTETLKGFLEILRDNSAENRFIGLAMIWAQVPEMQDLTIYHYNERT